MSDVWTRPLAEHDLAVNAFMETVRAIPDDVWARPPGPDKWAPAQVAAHVILTYEYLLFELGGGPPLRLRPPPLMRALLRWFLLPHILFHRSIPVRVRAPKEVRPDDAGLTRAETEARLRAAADRMAREVRTSSRPYLTHPYFGRLKLPKAVRFVAAHTEHHRRQIASAGT